LKEYANWTSLDLLGLFEQLQEKKSLTLSGCVMASRNNNPENPFAALLDPHHFPSQKERKGTITQEKQKIHRHRTSEQNV